MHLRIFIIAVLCILPLMSAAQNDISISMSLSSDAVSLGGQVTLIITINGPQNLPRPEMPNLSMFDAFSQGTSTNISIVNGQMEYSVTYSYLLSPKREGTFVIKPAVLVYNQKRYTSNEVTLKVVGAGVQAPQSPEPSSTTEADDAADIFMTAEVDKKSVFVNQQITLSIKFFYAVRLYSQPDYTAPQLTDFWPYEISPQKTYYEIIKGRRYNVIEMQTALFPTRPGDLTIGPAMINAAVPGKPRRRTDPFRMFDDFFSRGENKIIRSRPIAINVRPLPAEGKPADFSGTVGRYKITSSVDKRTVGVNNPVTVTYKINGTGNVKTVAEPVFGDTKDFRVYRASSDEKISQVENVIGGTKIFEEVFIPKRAGKLVIPEARLNYFDPLERKYKELSTGPYELTVNPATGEEYADIPYRPVAGRVIDDGAKDILYIKTDPGDLLVKRSLIVVRPIYIIINGIPLLLLLGALVSRRWKDKLSGDVGYARSRGARRMARKRLAKAKKLARLDNAAAFYAEIRAAVFSYVADKLNISPHGLTSDRIVDVIAQSGAQEYILDDTKDLLRKADFAQYSSADVNKEQIDQSLKMAEKVMVDLEGIKIA